MGKAFAAAPLLLLPVAAYNILALALVGGLDASGLGARLGAPIVDLRIGAGGNWPVSIADLLIAATVIVMFVELVKSTHSRRVALVNHILSIVLFIACLAEMLLLAAFATSSFFLITLMVLLDVVAGFILGRATRAREPGITR